MCLYMDVPRVVLKVLARSSYRLHYILHLGKYANNNNGGYASWLKVSWVFRRSLDILKPYFGSLLLEEQGILDKPESWEKVLNILPDAGKKIGLGCHCLVAKKENRHPGRIEYSME